MGNSNLTHLKSSFMKFRHFVTLAMFIGLLYSCADQNKLEAPLVNKSEDFKSFTMEDYEAFGQQILNDFHAELIHTISSRMDMDYFVWTVNQGLNVELNGKTRKDMEALIRTINQILYKREVGRDQLFEVTKVYLTPNGIPHLVISNFKDEGWHFNDYELAVKEGQLVIRDYYNYLIGEDFSDYVRFFVSTIYTKGSNARQRSMAMSEALNGFRDLKTVTSLLNSGRRTAAIELYDKISGKYTRENIFQTIKLRIDAAYSAEQYDIVVQKLQDSLQVESRMAAINLLAIASDHGDSENVRRGIDQLIKLGGESSIYYVFLAMSELNSGNFQQALETYQMLSNAYPNYESFYWQRLNAGYAVHDDQEVTNVLKAMHERYKYESKDFKEFFSLDAQFMESDVFKAGFQ